MPLPADTKAFFEFVAKGDISCIQFLEAFVTIVGLADDAVDRDLDAGSRQDMMVQLLWLVMVSLPRNVFYATHQVALSGVLGQALILWQTSDDWKLSGDDRRRHFAYVHREAVDAVFIMVAGIMGGASHARDVVERIMDDVHATNDTFPQWAEENDR